MFNCEMGSLLPFVLIGHDEHERSLLISCLSAPNTLFVSFSHQWYPWRVTMRVLYCVVPLEITRIHNCIKARRYVANCRGAIAEEVQKNKIKQTVERKKNGREGEGHTKFVHRTKTTKNNKKIKGRAGKSPGLHYPCFRCWMLVGCWDGCMGAWVHGCS